MAAARVNPNANNIIQRRRIYRKRPRLVTKVQKYKKKWNWITPTDNSNGPKKMKTVWHRDITAAKCILYKGMGIEIILKFQSILYLTTNFFIKIGRFVCRKRNSYA